MTDLNSVPKIIRAIHQYAAAYAKLQRLQKHSGLIPTGDQKTGCIGEFFVYLYLAGRYPGQPLRYAGHSNKGWDIEVGVPGKAKRIQTKTVSEYSGTRRLSPIAPGWDDLFIVYLDLKLEPVGFWIVTERAVIPKTGVLKHCSCPHPNGRHRGSAAIPFGKNRVQEMNRFVTKWLEA